MSLCCSNPPCGDLKQCKKSKKVSRKKHHHLLKN